MNHRILVLVQLVLAGTALALLGGCGDLPSSAADETLAGAPAGPTLAAASTPVELGSGPPEPGVPPGSGDAATCANNDLRCLCEVYVAHISNCALLDGDGQQLFIPSSACADSRLLEALADDLCTGSGPSLDCALALAFIECLVDNKACSEDAFEGCLQREDDLVPTPVGGVSP